MDGAQVLEALLLRQDEHHRVVTVPAARVNLQKRSLLILMFLGPATRLKEQFSVAEGIREAARCETKEAAP